MIAPAEVRVVFLLDSLGAGGTEHSTVELARRLPDHDIEPVLVALKRTSGGEEQRALDAGVDVRILDEAPIRQQVIKVRSVLAELRPTVLHTAIARADLVGRLAAIGTQVPVISSLVNTPYTAERLGDPAVRRWKLRAFQLADALTARLLVTRFHAVTPGVRDHAVRHLRLRPDRIVVIERGRAAPSSNNDPEVPFVERPLVTRSEQQPLLLAVGRQEFQKGFDTVIASMALLSQRQRVQLLIAGRKGNASQELRTLADRLDVAGSVQFLGQRHDVDDLLAAADVFVLSSRYEGTAGAALEAMAAGTPIVSTRLEGMTGILVHDHNALVVEPNDPSALADALEALLADRTLGARLATQAFEDFTVRFNIDRHVERMAQLYRSTGRTASR